MQRGKSRKRHTKKQAGMRLVLIKRTLQNMEMNVCAHQEKLDKNIEKVIHLTGKMERLWLQPPFFDEVITFVRCYSRVLEDVTD